jgi:uncharacterized protein (DUF302 family)
MPTASELQYGYVRSVALNFEDAIARLEAALKAEGFGVLCQIDIQAKLREKLGVDFPRYTILGACNPPLAHQALRQEMNLGLLLPCNAVVYEKDGSVWAGVVDAGRMLSIVGNPQMGPMAEEVNGKLRRALDSLPSA